MSSLESKIEDNNSSNDEIKVESKKSEKEFDWDDYILQEDDIQCSICGGIHEKGTFAPTPGIKKKGSKKTYSHHDICGNCQMKTHLCPNNCGTYLSITTFINGHNPNLCRIAYVKSHPHTDKDAKIAELQNQLKEMTTWRNFWSREYDSLQEKNKILEEKYEIFSDIIQEIKTYIESDLHPRLAQMSLSTCSDCRECEQHTIDKHKCTKCRPCDNCKNTIRIGDDDSIYMNDEELRNIYE